MHLSLKAICLFPTIILTAILFGNTLHAQSLQITDDFDQPIIGATAYTSDLEYSALSDEGGLIDLSVFPDTSTITIRFYGYQVRELELKSLQVDKIKLKPINFFFDEFVLVGDDKRPLSQQIKSIEILKPESLGSFQAQTPADLLANSGQVFVQKSQMGGGSPILRGFEASRILLVVDGVKMNNAIYRSGHLQNSITLSNQALQQAEIIQGPASLLYGSDALGGVIHYRTRKPQLKDKETVKTYRGSLSTSYNSANNGTVFSSVNEISGKKFASLSIISLSDFNTLKAGKRNIENVPDTWRRFNYQGIVNNMDTMVSNQNPEDTTADQSHVLEGTAYEQLDILQKITYKPNTVFQLDLNFQFSSSSDIPRYDQLSEKNGDTFTFAEWYYGPQNRTLASAQMNYTNPTKLFDESRLTLAYQNIEESRINRRFNAGDRFHNMEQLDVWSGTWVFQKKIKKVTGQRIFYGLDAQLNQLNSTGFTENIYGDQPASFFSRYPSGLANSNNLGLFTNYLIRGKSGKNQLNIGIRGSGHYTELIFEDTEDFSWPSNYKDGSLTINNKALVGSIAYKHKISKKSEFNASLSNAFRAPNIDDLGKIRVKGDFVNVPNPNITPEKTYTAELSFKRSRSKLNYSGNLYYTLVNDLLVRKPTEEVLIPGFTSLANINASNGFIYGFTGNLNIPISSTIEVNYTLGYTKGRYNYLDVTNSIDTLVAMGHIPPLYGNGRIEWKLNRFECALVHRFNGKKRIKDYEVLTISSDTGGNYLIDREGSSDNLEYGFIDFVDGEPVYKDLPAWQSLNLYVSWSTDKQRVFLSIENIFDRHYRSFSSGLSAAGRNIGLGVIFNY